MNQVATMKYTIKNLDCANCAAKIENSLNKLDCVKYASLNFATQTLYLQTENLDKVSSQIQFIEPGVELIPYEQEAIDDEVSEHGAGWFTKETVSLAIAILLLGSLLLAENWFHQIPIKYFEQVTALIAYFLAGWNVIVGALRTIRRGIFFDENVLMVIATCGAFAIHAYAEAIGVMIFFKIGELLQERAINSSRRTIRGLLAAKPNKAYVQTPEGLQETIPESVKIGDIIVVKPGQKIPLDGEVLGGSTQVDTSVLTGESIPVMAHEGDHVLAGAISMTGAITIKVTRPFSESSISKVMELVENAASRKAKTEKFITSFARYYTPVVVFLAICIAVLPPLLAGASFETWIYRALVMLVISCPCALVISIPLGYFAGIGKASRQGILVKGSNFIDALTAVKTVVFDKTGTLTKGVFKVERVVCKNGFTKNELLEFAAAAELFSEHPIALSIRQAYEDSGGVLEDSLVSNHTDYSGKGVGTLYGRRSVLVGNDALLHSQSIEHDKCEFDTTVAHVIVDGEYAGYITIGDELKTETKKAISELRKIGIENITMLTGDNTKTAEKFARELSLDSYYADLLPEDKVEKFEEISNANKNKGKTAFVGDGINDAPVLARSDVGIAMGGVGSDAAIETADVVLMTDSPLKIVEAISISKTTRRIVWQNIILAFSVKSVFLVLGAIGLATMWEAVFADVGTALLAVANSSRILKKHRQ